MTQVDQHLLKQRFLFSVFVGFFFITWWVLFEKSRLKYKWTHACDKVQLGEQQNSRPDCSHLCSICRQPSLYRYSMVLDTTAKFVIMTIWLSWNLRLTLVLLNPDRPCLCKQCRSRSVGFWRSQLIWICTVCHSVQQPWSNNLIGWKL